MSDHHLIILDLGQCNLQLRKKLNVEYTLEVLEDRRQSHIMNMNPLTLLKNTYSVDRSCVKRCYRRGP